LWTAGASGPLGDDGRFLPLNGEGRFFGHAAGLASATARTGDARCFADQTGERVVFSEQAGQFALQTFDALLEIERAT
jgi:hypothetical protein